MNGLTDRQYRTLGERFSAIMRRTGENKMIDPGALALLFQEIHDTGTVGTHHDVRNPEPYARPIFGVHAELPLKGNGHIDYRKLVHNVEFRMAHGVCLELNMETEYPRFPLYIFGSKINREIAVSGRSIPFIYNKQDVFIPTLFEIALAFSGMRIHVTQPLFIPVMSDVRSESDDESVGWIRVESTESKSTVASFSSVDPEKKFFSPGDIVVLTCRR